MYVRDFSEALEPLLYNAPASGQVQTKKGEHMIKYNKQLGTAENETPPITKNKHQHPASHLL